MFDKINNTSYQPKVKSISKIEHTYHVYSVKENKLVLESYFIITLPF